MKAHESARRENRKSTNSSPYLWLLPVLLLVASAIVLSAPAAAADSGTGGGELDGEMALSAASTFAGQQGRAGATRGSSGGGATATRSGGSSSGGRGTASRGTSGGSAGRARPGGGGGSGRVTVHRPPRTGGGHFRGRFFFPRYHHYFGFSFFRYPYYYGYYIPSYYHGYPRVLWYDYPASASLGGLDLNIKPKKAEVYIDGQRIGRVGRFDGYPSVLWLEEGTYDLVVYHPEHQTLHQTVKVFAGLVIDIDERLVPGVPTPPEEIVPPPAPAPAYDEEERVARGREQAPPPARELDLRHQPARLHLTIEPRDASVYLDGRFLGTGDELADLRSGLMVNAGEHQLSVVRPSYESEELTVDVAAGEDLELAIRLRHAGRVEEETDAENDAENDARQ